MKVRKPEAKEARENASKSEPATDPNATGGMSTSALDADPAGAANLFAQDGLTAHDDPH